MTRRTDMQAQLDRVRSGMDQARPEVERSLRSLEAYGYAGLPVAIPPATAKNLGATLRALLSTNDGLMQSCETLVRNVDDLSPLVERDLAAPGGFWLGFAVGITAAASVFLVF